MDVEQFNSIFDKQIATCAGTLVKKADEYATADRLHNFKVAAALQNSSPMEALAGMMAKHTVSIYDMCIDIVNWSIEVWDEKITDHINYLILLRAIVEEG